MKMFMFLSTRCTYIYIHTHTIAQACTHIFLCNLSASPTPSHYVIRNLKYKAIYSNEYILKNSTSKIILAQCLERQYNLLKTFKLYFMYIDDYFAIYKSLVGIEST